MGSQKFQTQRSAIFTHFLDTSSHNWSNYRFIVSITSHSLMQLQKITDCYILCKGPQRGRNMKKHYVHTFSYYKYHITNVFIVPIMRYLPKKSLENLNVFPAIKNQYNRSQISLLTAHQ